LRIAFPPPILDGINFLFCACVNCLDGDVAIQMEGDAESGLRKLTGALHVDLGEAQGFAHW
jgi:hypothetical protein